VQNSEDKGNDTGVIEEIEVIEETDTFKSHFNHPLYASGHIILVKSTQNLLTQSFLNHDIITVIEKLLEFDVVRTEPVPEDFEGTYLDLFNYFLNEENLLLFGATRVVNTLFVQLRYAVCVPRNNVIVEKNDKIFLLNPSNYFPVEKKFMEKKDEKLQW